MPGDDEPLEPGQGSVVGAAARPSSSSRSPTTTCRARASATPRSSGAGGRTSRRATAPTRSSRSCRRTSWRRSSPAEPLTVTRRFATLPRRAPLARRVVVGVGRLLRRARRLGHVAQVDADARPGRRAAAHRVDQHVVDGEQRGGLGVARLPALEARPAPRPCSASCATVTSGIFARGWRFARRAFARARDGATRGASPSILRKCGGQGASPRPAASSRAASSSSASSEPARVVHRARADRRRAAKRAGIVAHREVGRLAVRRPRPSRAAPRRARRAAGAPSRPSRWCGPWRSGCSRGRRRGAPPSTTSRWRAPARAARSRATAPAPRAAPR